MNNGELANLIDGAAETVILGNILHGGDAVYREAEQLSPDDFAIEANRVVFAAIQAVAAEVDPDVGAVVYHLNDSGRLQSAGGFEGLMRIHEAALPGAPLGSFVRSVREKSLRRTAWRLNKKLTLSLENGADPSSDEFRATAEAIVALGEESNRADGAIRNVADLPAVSAEAAPVRYICGSEVVEGAVLLLAGDSGSGKSTLASMYAREAIKRNIPVLILDRESPRSVALDRMQRLGIEDSELLRWWGGWLPREAPGPEAAIVRKWVESIEPKPLVIVDSAIAFLQTDENDATAVRRFMHLGPRRLTDLGATVIVIHHDGKSETARDFRGSSDFKAAVDQAFHVTNLSDDGKLDRLTLRSFKSRFGFSGSVIYSYSDGRFIRDERADAPARNVADQLTALLRTNPGIGAKEFEDLAVRQAAGRQRARDFLSNGVLGGLVRRESGTRNRQRFYLAEAE